MSPEYLRKLADIADPDETWRTADLLDYLRLSEEKRQQHDTGVALRRYAEHLEPVKRALEEKRSVLITPLSESGCAVRLADTPEDHARLRDKRADMQPPRKSGGIEDEDAFEAVQDEKSMKTSLEQRRLHERRAAMSLGQLLRAKRDALGMTLDEVAEAAGCSKSHLHSLEGDKCEPGILMCAKLSVALGLSVQAMAAAAICGALQKAPQHTKGD